MVRSAATRPRRHGAVLVEKSFMSSGRLAFSSTFSQCDLNHALVIADIQHSTTSRSKWVPACWR